jgi:PhzF family phenazine biosynthesis protein
VAQPDALIPDTHADLGELTVVVVDAFAAEPFTGNPAGVCVLPAPVPEAWMQAVATEVNLSETAFLVPGADGWALRWFTPALEIDLCGHATLASAHVLWTEGLLPPDETARFSTRSGLLTCTLGDGGEIAMDFPSDPVHAVDEPAVAAAVGHRGAPTFRGGAMHLVELPSPDAVRALDPDLRAVAAACPAAVIVTAAGGQPGVDCTSRVFGPSVGIDEDPVTGSAHCTLAGFWGDRLGRDELVGWQASRRGGRVGMRRRGDRVELLGTAVLVARSVLEPAARP